MYTKAKLSSEDVAYRRTAEISGSSNSALVASAAYNLKLSRERKHFGRGKLDESVSQSVSHLPFFFIIDI